VSDGPDTRDEPAEPFAEYGEVDEKYREPEEMSIGPEIPEAPDLTDRDVDPVVEGTFWMLVVVFNIGLIAVSVGVMFVILQGNLVLGGQIALAGAVVLSYGIYRYRSAKQVISDRVGDTETGGTADSEAGGTATDDRNE
jgi:hypothetical protein